MTDKTPEPSVLDTGVHKILAVQAFLLTGVAWTFYGYQGLQAAQSVLYGGSMAMLNVWLMHRRIQTAAQIAKIAPNKEISVFYIAALQRFMLTLGLFIIGMGGLQLPPIPMIVAFGIAQIGYFFKGN